jgi:hypothetical protein
MKKGDKAIRANTMPVKYKDGEWVYETTKYEVRIMAIAEGYAMIRRKGCLPSVCSIKELEVLI